MRHFHIYTNWHKDREMIVTRRIEAFLSQKGYPYTIRQEGDASIPPETDCMLVLGGDGTMLQAVRDLAGRSIPLLGVNLGNLGYMTEVEPEYLEDSLEKLLAGEYELENRMMLWAKAQAEGGEEVEGWALNDVIISRRGSLKITEFNIYVNGQFLNRYSADGVIVTTPTGSTGYNLSAGGPIVDPRAKLMMITPICPHTLNQRSIILVPEDKIVIEIPVGREGQSQEVEANLDGAKQIPMCTGNSITITRSEKTVEFIKLNKVSFLETLRRKMSEN